MYITVDCITLLCVNFCRSYFLRLYEKLQKSNPKSGQVSEDQNRLNFANNVFFCPTTRNIFKKNSTQKNFFNPSLMNSLHTDVQIPSDKNPRKKSDSVYYCNATKVGVNIL